VAAYYTQYVQGTGRLVPEALFFLTDLLSLVLVSNLPSGAGLENAAASFVRETSGEPLLRLSSSASAKRPANKKARKSVQPEEAAAGEIPPINFLEIFSKKPSDPYFTQDLYKYPPFIFYFILFFI
jgi:hypothetical protein